MPRDARVLFLPQKPYLPIGTLREVVSYPMPTGGLDDATLREALEAVGLPGTAVVSVGHRGTLRPFHARQLVVRPNGSGPASIVEIAAAS